MNNRVLGVILAIAGIALLIVGAFAFIELFRRSFTDVEIVQPTPVPVVKAQVVVTTHDIFRGNLLEATDVTEIEVPAEFVPRDAVASAEDVIDKFIKVDLVQGEMILEHNLADPTNIQHDLSFALSDEHVLYAFPVGDTMTRYSLIQQGDIVDLIASLPLVVEQVEEDVPEGTIVIQAGDEEGTGTSTLLTFDASQKISITGLVMDIIVPEEVEESEEPPPEDDVTAPPSHRTKGVGLISKSLLTGITFGSARGLMTVIIIITKITIPKVIAILLRYAMLPNCHCIKP